MLLVRIKDRMTSDGWLEPGDIVEAGDFVLMGTGDFLKMTSGGYAHRAHHNPKWRTPKPPNHAARLSILIAWQTENERHDR